MVKNLKHGLKVTKRDIAISTMYYVLFNNTVISTFHTKLDAINQISCYLNHNPEYYDKLSLIKVQSIKF